MLATKPAQRANHGFSGQRLRRSETQARFAKGVADWPPAYETLLAELRERWPEGRGVREFLEILALHREYPARQVEQAIQEALTLGAAHLDGVRLCLSQQEHPQSAPASLDLSAHPRLQGLGEQPLDLARYNQLLQAGVR